MKRTMYDWAEMLEKDISCVMGMLDMQVDIEVIDQNGWAAIFVSDFIKVGIKEVSIGYEWGERETSILFSVFNLDDEEMMERNAVSTPDPKEAVSHIIRLIRQKEERKAIHEAYKEERE